MNTQDKLPTMITVIAIIAAIFFCKYSASVKEDIASLQADQQVLDKQLKIYDNINQNYGAASKDFYSSKSIVVLNGKDATTAIPVYWAKSYEKGISYDPPSSTKLTHKWGEWHNHWIDLTINSKVDSGYETLTFSNKINNETFKVLVIVK